LAEASSNPYIQVANDFLQNGDIVDYFQILTQTPAWSGDSRQSLSGPSIGPWTLLAANIQLFDPTATAISSVALPLTELDASMFVSPNFTYMNMSFHNAASQTTGVLARFVVTAVPEVDSYALMLVGLGLVAFAARCRRNAARPRSAQSTTPVSGSSLNTQTHIIITMDDMLGLVRHNAESNPRISAWGWVLVALAMGFAVGGDRGFGVMIREAPVPNHG
jgi:hypothetical protein